MVDAITTQVVRNRVSSLMQEMHYHFYRSGYSTIIRESRDFSCVILDCRGGLIVAPPMFFHAPVYRHLVGKILQRYGNDVHPGDMFVCNHPYEGGLPHVSDMAFVAPILSGGTLVGFAGSIAHKADVGGTNPGSTSANATEIFQEGLLLPPVKISSRGVFNDDLERLILANSRQPELVRGDMHAQMAATQMGADRILKTCEQFGVAAVMEAFAALLHGAAEELRAAIRTLPDGEASAEGFMDNDGVELDRPVRFAVTVRVKNGEIEFDLTNSDRQARGPVNLRPSMVEACVFYCLIGALDPKLQFQRRHARGGAVHLRAQHRHQCQRAGAGLFVSGRQSEAHRRDPAGAGAVPPGARGRQWRFERRHADLVEGRRSPGAAVVAIRNSRLGLWGRQRQ